jgi:SAM-dependent methyltransferase
MSLGDPRETTRQTENERSRVADIYRAYAASFRKRRSWSSDNPGNIAIREELTDAISAVAPELRGARRILDIGCGSGWFLEHLTERADVHAELHGLEILPQRVEAARRRVPAAVVEVGDLRSLAYPDGQFDVVSMFTVLSSLADDADVVQAVREAGRVTAPAGVLVIWEPRLPNPLNRSTLLIRGAILRSALPEAQIESRTLTVLPPLARRLGRATKHTYPRLARLPPLRSHRLWSVRLSADHLTG